MLPTFASFPSPVESWGSWSPFHITEASLLTHTAFLASRRNLELLGAH